MGGDGKEAAEDLAWRVSLIKGKRQQQLGAVYAPDAAAATRAAKREYSALENRREASLARRERSDDAE